ncbi:hypothetical protein M9H77_29706 [Catharanthus roseus]|uniref:Uncharacterized protein n=1 Tax=Catharanthus roseus TaxID=4058 RepID=A0ACB9ZVZ4_CATRO|nr:hypothetical protein M9H77_29706 [Catharanthus roseus]
MYEISQTVDLSLKFDALSKKARIQILDSHTQSIAKLETQIWQLANAMSRKDEAKFPSHPIENPRANYHEVDESLPYILKVTRVSLELVAPEISISSKGPFVVGFGDN